MRRTAIMTSLSDEVMRRIRHFGDFVTLPLAIVFSWTRLASIASIWSWLASLPGRWWNIWCTDLSSTVILWADAFISFIMTIQAIRMQKDRASVRRSLHSRLDVC